MSPLAAPRLPLLVRLISPSHRNLALDVLRSGFETAPLLVQEAQMDFIASLFKPVAPLSPERPASPPLALRPYAASLLRVIRVALTSERLQLRVLACGVLGSPLLAELKVDGLQLEPLEEALRLLEDGEASVRAAAVRAVGMLVKSSSVGSVSRPSLTRCDTESLTAASTSIQQLPTIIVALMTRCSDEEPVKSTASWSLANCCDVLTPRYALAGPSSRVESVR